MADFGRHASRGHQQLGRPTRDVRVHVRHVDSIAKWRVGSRDSVDLLRHRHALTGECRFIYFEGCRLQQAAVRRHAVAGLEEHDVTWHELLGGQLHNVTRATNSGLDNQHLLQRGDACLGLAFLAEPHHGVEQREPKQNDACAPLLQRHDRDHTGDQQNHLHRVLELAEERLKARLLLLYGEGIRTILLGPRFDVRDAQTGGAVDALDNQGVVEVEGVPCWRCTRGRSGRLALRVRYGSGHSVIPRSAWHQ